ncbi:MAG: flagellar hook-associated protein 2 [Pseudomonadota bacterium]|jgi:flagellar hook-associated protein 2
MATIQSLGVGSGLDVNSIISQLMAIERQPLQRMQQVAQGVQSQISLYGQVQAKVDALGTAAQALASSTRWRETRVNLNGAEAYTVTATASAEPMNLEIEVHALAQRQSVSTQAFDDASSTVGTGILSIQRGQWSENFGAFTPDPQASAIEIEIGATSSSLTGVRDAINAANAGITASILTDAQGARLVLRSTTSGAEQGFEITTLGGTDDFGALGFTAQTNPASSSGAQGNVRATDLLATVNGATVQSDTNTLNNVLDGVSITALKPTSGPGTVTIDRDTAAAKTRIQEFVTAYNDVANFLKAQTAYNEATKTGAPLQGDRVALLIQNSLRELTTDSTGASSVFSRLADIGITMQKGGALSVNEGTLDNALQNIDEVAALFSADNTDDADDGLALRLADIISDMTGSDGNLSAKRESLQGRLRRNQDEQERLEDRLVSVEERLKAQYSALDNKMASINGLAQYVSKQFSAAS